MVHDHCEAAANCGADHEHRGQSSAGRSRTERKQNDNSFENQKQKHRSQSKAHVQYIPDRLVSRAKHAREKVADNTEAQRSDGGMQQGGNFLQMIEEFLQPFQCRGKSNRRESANDAQESRSKESDE